MKIRHIAAVSTLTAVFLFTQICVVVWGEAVREVPESVRVLDNAVQEPGRLGQGLQEMGQKIPQVVDMIPTSVEAERLYSLSAVLMDGDSGRVLYEKDGEAARANASTTKVLTCIVALESSPGDDYVQVSKNAASQPEVKLGIQPGEQYYLEDLLYSLMLDRVYGYVFYYTERAGCHGQYGDTSYDCEGSGVDYALRDSK